MKGNSRQAEDEAIKARERAARSGTTVVPNLATMLQGDAKQNSSRNGPALEAKLPATRPGAVSVSAAAPPPAPSDGKSTMSREEADRLLKEREKQRAPRIAVVPNLADFVDENPPSAHFTVEKTPAAVAAAAATPPPLVASKSAPVAPRALSQQEQDEIIKQRERNARAAAVVPDLANRLGSIARLEANGPEPPELRESVSAPHASSAASVSAASTTTTSSQSMSRSTARSSEDRDNQLKQQEKRLRQTNRMMMTTAQRLSQQEQDVIEKERERKSAEVTVVSCTTGTAESLAGDGKSLSSSNPEDAVRARFEAATLAMSGNITQDEKDQLLKERERLTTYQAQSQPQDKANSVPEPVTAGVAPSPVVNRVSQPNTARRGITPGALAVSDGIAQELNKAVLTHVEQASTPEYVIPAYTTGTDRLDAMEGQRTPGVYGTDQPMDQKGESEPVFEAQTIPVKEMEPQPPSLRKWYILGAVVVIVIIAVAVGVAVGGGGKSDGSAAATEGSSGPPSPAPVVETQRRISLRDALVASGVSSTEQLTDSTAPQYQALTWLADVDSSTEIKDTSAVTQRYALAVFYYSMNGPGWTTSTGWLDASLNVCEWPMITCAAGEVTTIKEQSPINMEGVLPTELNALTSLQTLVIEKNTVRGFDGPIDQLIELQLNEAKLGEIFKDIPSTILEMTNLQRLYLKSNSLIGTIPTEIEKLTALNILDVSSNSFTGTLPTQLQVLTSLTDISFLRNQLGGEVSTIIEGLPNLRSFIGSSNSFTGTIGSGLTALSNLQRLELRLNRLTGPFPNFIASIPSLGILDLVSNGLTGTISTTIGELGNLADLSLSENAISGSIPTEIGRVSRLRRLQVEKCRMTGGIPTEIGLLSEMTFLQLNDNVFDGPIPTELGNLGGLQILYLDNNSLTGNIPSQLGQISSLSDLRLVNNALSGTLPSEICSIPTLTRVILVDAFPRDGLSCGDCSKCI